MLTKTSPSITQLVQKNNTLLHFVCPPLFSYWHPPKIIILTTITIIVISLEATTEFISKETIFTIIPKIYSIIIQSSTAPMTFITLKMSTIT